MSVYTGFNCGICVLAVDLAPLLPYGAAGLYLAGAVVAADLVKEAIVSRLTAAKPPANESANVGTTLRQVEHLCGRILEAVTQLVHLCGRILETVTRLVNSDESHHKSRNTAEDRILDAIQNINERLIRLEARREP